MQAERTKYRMVHFLEKSLYRLRVVFSLLHLGQASNAHAQGQGPQPDTFRLSSTRYGGLVPCSGGLGAATIGLPRFARQQFLALSLVKA